MLLCFKVTLNIKYGQVSLLSDFHVTPHPSQTALSFLVPGFTGSVGQFTTYLLSLHPESFACSVKTSQTSPVQAEFSKICALFASAQCLRENLVRSLLVRFLYHLISLINLSINSFIREELSHGL